MIHEEFIQAMENLHLCTLYGKDGKTRLVEPYGVFLTQQNHVMYCCYQLGGYTGSGNLPNWRNVPVSEVTSVEISSRTFRKQASFNPHNKDVYYQWVEKI